MKRPLSDYRVITFDCYGTLIDWETGIWDALQPLITANGRRDVLRAGALRTFAQHESSLQTELPGLPYPEVLARVHRGVAGDFGMLTTEQLDLAFGASVPHWPAFADTADSLRALRGRYHLVVLSNVDRAGFEASNRKLGVEFDAVYTAEEIGSTSRTWRTSSTCCPTSATNSGWSGVMSSTPPRASSTTMSRP